MTSQRDNGRDCGHAPLKICEGGGPKRGQVGKGAAVRFDYLIAAISPEGRGVMDCDVIMQNSICRRFV